MKQHVRVLLLAAAAVLVASGSVGCSKSPEVLVASPADSSAARAADGAHTIHDELTIKKK